MASTPKETTTKTEPWDGAKPYLNKYYAQADQAMSNGQPMPWQGDLIAKQSDETKRAQEMISQTAMQGSQGIKNAQNAVNNITSGAAFQNNPAANTLAQSQNWTNPGVQATQDAMKNINTNYSNPALGQAANAGNFSNAAFGLQQEQARNLAGANNPANSMLAKTANGEFLGANEYLMNDIANANKSMMDQFKNITSPQLDSQAMMAGRSGSGAAASIRNDAESTVANAMAKNATTMLGDNYARERQNMLGAQNSMGNFYNTDVANQLGANANLANTSNSQQDMRNQGTNMYGNLANATEQIRQGAVGQQLSGAGQLGQQAQAQQGMRNDAATNYWQQMLQQSGQQLAGAGMAGDMRELDYKDADRLAGVGAQKDAYSDASLEAQIRKWDLEQNKDIMNAANMINMVTTGGYNNQTKPVQSSGLGGGLGILTALLGLL